MGASGKDPASVFLVSLHVLLWTAFVVGLTAILVVFMLN